MTAQNQQGFPDINLPVIGSTGQLNQNWYQFLISLWNRTGGATGSQTFVTGDIKASATTVVQDGWLLCDGSAVSRSQYQQLFGTIGTIWGVGDGSTTFNVPNLVGKFPQGGASVGTTGGDSNVTLATTNLPAHNHPVIDPGHLHGVTDPGHSHAINDPGHAHGYDQPVYDAVGGGGTNSVSDNSTGATTDSAVTDITVLSHITNVSIDIAETGISTGDTGSGSPFSVINPFAVVNFLVKT